MPSTVRSRRSSGSSRRTSLGGPTARSPASRTISKGSTAPPTRPDPDASSPRTAHEAAEEGREMKNITVLGTGVLGSQIAFQTAFHGFDVVAYDIDQAALDRAAERFDALAARYVADGVENAADGGAQAAIGRIRLTSDLSDSAVAADLVIEAVPENLELKQGIYRTLANAAPATTIFATNSSTLLPSTLAESTGR